VTILFIGTGKRVSSQPASLPTAKRSPVGLPRLLHKESGCVTDKQPIVSSVGVFSMQL